MKKLFVFILLTFSATMFSMDSEESSDIEDIFVEVHPFSIKRHHRGRLTRVKECKNIKKLFEEAVHESWKKRLKEKKETQED